MKNDVVIAGGRADRFTLRTPAAEYAEVTRRVPVSRTRLDEQLAGVAGPCVLWGGRLELDGPFLATETWAGPAWRTSGRIVTDRPRTRQAHIELDVTGWSCAVSEL